MADKRFMSEKILKVHGKARSAVRMDRATSNKEAEVERSVFRCVSREIQQLGTQSV